MGWLKNLFARRVCRPIRRPIQKRRPRTFRPGIEVLECRLVPSIDVLTYHNDAASSGLNTNETVLTPANVNSTDFGKLFATPVDGQVYAQPLYVENVKITTGANQGTHNVVYVATENDSLYAIDANTGTILWHDALLTPEHGGTVTAVPASAVNSSDISPVIGITATPVIDQAANTIFVENKTQEVASNGTHFEHHLYAIDLGTGAITKDVLIADSIGDTYVSGPEVAGTGAGSVNGVVQFDALRQLDRPGLTLVNGNIYLAYASHGDNGPYHGWILGYAEASLAPTAIFNVNPNGADDGIWQSGGTLASETVNGNTYLYFETGNGTFDTTLTQSPFNANLMIPKGGDYGDSFVKVEIDGSTAANGSLNAANNINGWGMHVADYFTPSNEGNLSNGDTDLGSGAPLLLPASAGSAAHPNLMVGAGKEGRIYLIDRDNMGGYHGDAAGDGNSGFDNVVQETVTGAINGSLDTPIYWNGLLYVVGGYGDQARTFTIANGVMSSSSTTQSADSYGFPGSTPSLSANGTSNAIVWDIAGPGTNQLRAYNAADGYSDEIYTSAQAANGRDGLGSAVKFVVPTVADGEVFVGTTNSVMAYGLLQQATAAPAAPSNLSASAFSGSVINLFWTDNDTAPNSATAYNIFQSTNGTNFTQVGTASAGATSYAVGGLQVSTTYYFEISARNSKGTSTLSNVASATTTSQASPLDFSSGFAESAGVLTYNGSAKLNGTSAELTDGGNNEAGSVFSTNAVDITRFSNQFTFQLTSAQADGFTFTIQGDGPTALGGGGGSLGYQGLANSIAIKFDLFSNAGEGNDSTGEYTDGAVPTVPAIDLSSTGINLHSGDVFQVVMGYDGTTLNVTITDTTTNQSASQSYTVNIPEVIGSNTGYVGFTGGTGGTTAYQNILTWAFNPVASTLPAAPSNLTGTVISGNEVDISWTNNANNQTGFLIDRSTDGTHFSQIASVGATSTAYRDTSLSPGETVYYEVQARNAAGNSAFSNVFQTATVIPPSPPANLQATNITTTEIDLSWTNVATNATGLKILEQLGSNTARVIASGLAPTTTSYDITGLTAATPYLFEVDALNSSGPSGAATIAVDTLPGQVTGVTATGGPGQVTLQWTADPGALNYDVYRATSPGGEGRTPSWTAIAGTSFTDPTATPGTTYYYVVTAVDPNAASPTDPTAESAGSAEVSAAAQPGSAGTFGAPSNLVGTVQDGPQVQLSWNNNSSSATGFSVERATDAAFTQNVTLFAVAATSAATATYIDMSTVADTTYYYRVQAMDGSTATAFTNPVIEAIPAPPATPSDGHATLITTTEVDLAWTNNATNADVYKIFREVVGSSFSLIATLPASATSYQDTGLTPGTNYDYHIEAWNVSGNADRTGADLFTVSPAITNLTAAAGNSQVALWSAPAGGPEMTYNVYRGTTAGGEGATPIATGLTTTSFTDTGVTPGTTYYYEVTSVDPQSLATPSVAPNGENARSNEVSATPLQLVLAIAAGGGADGSFVADTDFTGGATATHADPINTSNVANPAPEAVYQSERYGNFSYAVPNLTPGASYTVRLDFAEIYWSQVGQRIFDVAINGTPVLTNFDIIAAAGGKDIAIAKSFSTTADASGTITIQFTSVVDNAKVSGIEIYAGNAALPAAPTNLAATASNNSVALTWTASSGATSYNVYRGTSPGGEGATPIATDVTTMSFTDTTAVNGTTYYYTVRAVNSTGSSASSSEASATPQAPATPPPAPTGLSATAGTGQISFSWAASSGATSYNVYRGTASGGESLLASGITVTSYVDSAVTSGTAYFYQVAAVNNSGAGSKSSEVSATPLAPGNLVLAIAAGGSSAGNFVADTDFTGGATATHADPIDTSNVANPAPQAVYQSERYGNFTYSIPNLTPGAAYTVRLDFAEIYWNQVGQRIFNVSINGTPVLTNFDIIAAAGGKDIAIAESFGTTTDASGTITIQFTTVKDNAKVSGIEIYAAPPAAPTSLAASAGNSSVALKLRASSGAASYNIYRSTSSGGEGATPYQTGITGTTFTDTGVSSGTTYYYQVTAVNSAGESGPSSEVSVTTPQAAGALVTAIDAGGAATGAFLADTDYVGGTTSNYNVPINTSSVSNPAPQAVWQSERYGNFTYTIPNLTPGASYTVQLDFAEIYWNAAGKRLFNVTINGARVLTNFDIFAAAGGKDIGIAESFTTTASSSGTITIQFTTVKDNAMVNGIQIFAN